MEREVELSKIFKMDYGSISDEVVFGPYLVQALM